MGLLRGPRGECGLPCLSPTSSELQGAAALIRPHAARAVMVALLGKARRQDSRWW